MAEWTEVGKKSLRPRGGGLTPLKRTRGRWNTEQKEPQTAALRKSRASWWEPEGHDCLLEHFCSGRSGLTWALSACSDISSNIWEEWDLYARASSDPEGVALEVVSWLYSQQFLTSREFPVAHQRPAEVAQSHLGSTPSNLLLIKSKFLRLSALDLGWHYCKVRRILSAFKNLHRNLCFLLGRSIITPQRLLQVVRPQPPAGVLTVPEALLGPSSQKSGRAWLEY